MFPRWLSWVFLASIAYVVISASNAGRMDRPVKSTVPAITAQQYPALARMTDLEGWKRTVDPSYAAKMNCTLDAQNTISEVSFKLIEDVSNKEPGAQCGETITVHLTVWGAGGATAYSADLPLSLGSRQLASGLDFGLLGISVNAVRTLVLPPYALTHGKPDKAYDAARKALPAGKLTIVTVKRIK